MQPPNDTSFMHQRLLPFEAYIGDLLVYAFLLLRLIREGAMISNDTTMCAEWIQLGNVSTI